MSYSHFVDNMFLYMCIMFIIFNVFFVLKISVKKEIKSLYIQSVLHTYIAQRLMGSCRCVGVCMGKGGYNIILYVLLVYRFTAKL